MHLPLRRVALASALACVGSLFVAVPAQADSGAPTLAELKSGLFHPSSQEAADPKPSERLVVPEIEVPEGRVPIDGQVGKEPTKLRELTDERTATSATWENTDGSYTIEQHVAPIHFLADTGSWQKIDTRLERLPGSDDRWSSGENSWAVELRPTGEGDAEQILAVEGHELAVSAVGVAAVERGCTQGQADGCAGMALGVLGTAGDVAGTMIGVTKATGWAADSWRMALDLSSFMMGGTGLAISGIVAGRQTAGAC